MPRRNPWTFSKEAVRAAKRREVADRERGIDPEILGEARALIERSIQQSSSQEDQAVKDYCRAVLAFTPGSSDTDRIDRPRKALESLEIEKNIIVALGVVIKEMRDSRDAADRAIVQKMQRTNQPSSKCTVGDRELPLHISKSRTFPRMLWSKGAGFILQK